MPDQHQRMFFALQPPEPIARALWALTPPLTHGRRLPWQMLHITLAFIGDADPAQQRQLLAIGDALSVQPFSLSLERLHYQPARGVLWAAPRGTPFALQASVRHLHSQLREQGLPVDSKPFRPHVTLARKAELDGGLLEIANPVCWPVDGFCLMASHLSPQGARYEVVRRWG